MQGLLRPFLLLTLLAAMSLAQSKGPSFIIHSTAKQGTDAAVAAEYLAGLIGKGLKDQFPCVDQIDDKGIGALLSWEKDRQTLGGESDSEANAAWQAVAGALGAKYTILVSATTLPGGQTYVSAKVIDNQTGRTIANRDAPLASGEGALDSGEFAAKKLLQDLSDLLKGRCDAHWTGTISKTYEKKTEKSTQSYDKSGYGESTSGSRHEEIVMEAILQPMSLGTKETNHPMARVTQKYEYHYDLFRTGFVLYFCHHPCKSSTKSSEIENENGQNTEVETATVNVYDGGRLPGKYEISVQCPAVTTKWRGQKSNTPPTCPSCVVSEPSTEVSSRDGNQHAGSIYAKGQIDGKDPNHLTGSEVTGDLENGRTTLRWDLTLVKPKPGK